MQGGFNNKNILPSSSADWKFEIKVCSKLVPIDGTKEESVATLYPNLYFPHNHWYSLNSLPFS